MTSFGAWLASCIVFLFVCLASSRIAVFFPLIGLPLITGHLFVGALSGPFALGVVQPPDIAALGFVTQFALSYIAFSAGSELYLPELRSLFRSIAYQTTAIAVFSFVICGIMLFVTAPLIPWLQEMNTSCRSSICCIAASIMVARSPASAIAVIKELRAKGPMTSTLLGVTVMCDVYVLLLFTLASTVTESSCSDDGFNAASLGGLFLSLFCCVVSGWIVGKFLILLMFFRRVPTKYLILPLGLLIFIGSSHLTEYSHHHMPFVFNLEPLLLCITAGYVCTNQSKHRSRFILVLQKAGPFIFLPFFVLTGASLDLVVFAKSFGFAVIISVIRAFSIFAGSFTGGWLAGQSSQHNKLIWMTLLTQAGVSLGLASEVGSTFKGWGRQFQATIISIVLLNQLAGPILFKIAIRKVGEAGKAPAEGAFDEDAEVPSAMIVGSSPGALSLAVNLLKRRWNVTVLADTKLEALAIDNGLRIFAAKDRQVKELEADEIQTVVIKNVILKPADKLRLWFNRFQDMVVGDHLESVELQDEDDEQPAKVSSENAALSDVNSSSSTGEIASDTTTSAAAVQPMHASQSKVSQEHHEYQWLLEEHLKVDWLESSATSASHAAASAAQSSDEDSQAAGSTAPDVAIEMEPVAPHAEKNLIRDIRLGKIIEKSDRSLHVIAVAALSDAANLADISVISHIIKAAPIQSHLHSVRLMSVCHNVANAEVYESYGATALHEFSLASAAAATLALSSIGKSGAIVEHTSSTQELAHNVKHEVIGTPLLWNLFGTSCGCGDYKSFAIAAKSKVDKDSVSGFSGTFRRMSSQITSVAREGLAAMLQSQDVQEVSSAVRGDYMSQLGALSEETLSATEGHIDRIQRGLGLPLCSTVRLSPLILIRLQALTVRKPKQRWTL
jgi:Kef-type K+ transport system membrane component KefB